MQTLTLTSIAVPRVMDGFGRLWRTLTRSTASTAPSARDRTAEAAEVRAWAQRYERTDPGFASDLYAAADRHELIGDDGR